MNKYGYTGKLEAKEGCGTELAQIMLKASKLVTKEHGCHMYLVSQDAENNNIIWITEVWDTKEDQALSLKNGEVRALIGQAMPILASMPKKGQELFILNF